MSLRKEVVLVTGGTGFVGSHIIFQLLERGYRIKAAVRKGKKEQLLSTYPQAQENQLEAFEITDIVDGDFGAAFEGIHALLHVASPLFYRGDPELIMKGATRGTENVLGQAIKAGVKRIVVTSSWVSLFEPDMIKAFQPNKVDETWWSNVKMEDASSQKRDHLWAYTASKPLAEQAAWRMAEENHDVDLTCILPAIIYGAFIPNYPLATDRSKLGTNEWIYHLIRGGPDGSKTYPRMGVAHFVDVKDVAKAHVRALEVGPLLAEDGSKRRKRLITVGGRFAWSEAAEYLKEARPELKDGLEKDEKGPKFISCCEVDMKLTKEVVDLGVEDMTPWKKCLLEAVDTLLDWERRISKAN